MITAAEARKASDLSDTNYQRLLADCAAMIERVSKQGGRSVECKAGVNAWRLAENLRAPDMGYNTYCNGDSGTVTITW